MTEIQCLLTESLCRLLTLHGPGGIGKSRLAAEVVARSKGNFADGVYHVMLQPLNRADQILPAIINALWLAVDGELRVLVLLGEGLRNPQKKLGAGDRHAAVDTARHHGLL